MKGLATIEMKTGNDHAKQSKYGLMEYCIIKAVIHTFSMALAIFMTNSTELSDESHY
jgi:hypothetical protein